MFITNLNSNRRNLIDEMIDFWQENYDKDNLNY